MALRLIYDLNHWTLPVFAWKIICMVQISVHNVCIVPSVCSSIFQPELVTWLLKTSTRSTTVVILGMWAFAPLSCRGELQCWSCYVAQVLPAQCRVWADAGGKCSHLYPSWLQSILWWLFVLPSALLSLQKSVGELISRRIPQPHNEESEFFASYKTHVHSLKIFYSSCDLD